MDRQLLDDVIMDWVGIDYGSKLAGTTVICYEKNKKLCLLQSEKKKDADLFISNFIKEHRPKEIYLDAPLSLPGAYLGVGDDYFYRKCDKATKAMSPMFLGGLTARAMKLAASHKEVVFKECYPGYLIRTVLDYSELYAKKSKYSPKLHKQLAKEFDLEYNSTPKNWHQLDAVVCWISGWRHGSGQGELLGEANEGLIWV